MQPVGGAPRIGMTTYREPASWGVWDQPAAVLPTAYLDAIVGAGGAPMLLAPPAAQHAAELADAVLDGVHGLVLTGGADVDPSRYDRPRDPATVITRPDRDEWEFALTRAALARALPVLAICRGLQVLNTVLGGDLIQHLPDIVGTSEHCPTPGVHARHDVRLAADSRLGAVLGERATVATYHHQAVDRIGAGLRATAWANDDTVEGLESADGLLLAVQWHPESTDSHALFAAFVDSCRQPEVVTS